MARTQKRKVGSLNYKTAYTENSLTSAIRAVNSSSMSIRKASKEFKIPFGTLRNKIKGLHSGKVGRPFRLSTECEVQILETIDCLATWRIPLTAQSLCHMVKGYLDSRGVVDSVFTNNLPGKDWLDQFVRRHGLTKRLADNVKTSQAEITASTISSYFDRLEQTAESIPAQNCFNYDETNIIDDPGSKKVIVRRGMRRVERKVKHSKQSIYIMFCGSASGVHFPPMVVYRAKNLYTNWTVGGPAGAVCDVTKSGWFDSRTFETWFVQLFLPSVSDPVHDPEKHNPEWTQSRMDTIPNGHNPEWTQSRMDTIPNEHHPEWTPSRMDTIPNGHHPEWTPSRMDTIPNGHHPEWTQSRMDTIPNGHNPERTQSRMDTISNGHHPEWTQSRNDTIPNGHNPEWTQSRMDTIPNGHNPEWTPSRMDTIPNGHNPEWTQSRMDTIPNGHNP